MFVALPDYLWNQGEGRGSFQFLIIWREIFFGRGAENAE